MKKLFLLLAAVIGLNGLLFADNSGMNKITAGGTIPAFFRTAGQTAAVTSTPSTIVGPGVLVKKLIFHPNVGSNLTITAFDLYDTGPNNSSNGTQNGVTFAAKSRQIVHIDNLCVGCAYTNSPAQYIVDFTAMGGNTSTRGLIFSGYPAYVTSGLVSPSVEVIYEPGYNNKTQP